MVIEKAEVGYIGQIADSSMRDVISYSAEDKIPVGFPVMRGTNKDRQVLRFNGGTTNEMVGIAIRSMSSTVGSYSDVYPQPYYAIKSTVGVLNKGRMWVPLYGTQTVVAGNIAYIDTLSDLITNTYVEFQTVPIGKFVTGGSTAAGIKVFQLELIPDYPAAALESVLDSQANDSEITNDNSKNIKKSKK